MVEQMSRDGQNIGNYRLLRLLGQGGFADVYLAEHIHLGTQAAVKLLNAQLADDGIEGFRNEARMIANLIHPHIVRVLDFGVDDKVPYLIMDYAPSGTLRQRHQKGSRIPLPVVVSYVQQMAEALQYAHGQRLIHRDIKPENMLVGRNQEILLSDFGIALVAQSSRYQRTQNIAGTLAYMAPEQIQAHPRPASDQYSLGIVVYEWLGGQRPFHGTMTEVAIKHATATPPSLRLLVPDLSPAVEQVILVALQKDPHNRFPSMLAFAQSLQQASTQPMQFAGGFSTLPASNLPINQPPMTPPGPVAPFVQNGIAQNPVDQFGQPVSQVGNQALFTPPYPSYQPSTQSQAGYTPYPTNQISSTGQTGQQTTNPVANPPITNPKHNTTRRTILAAIAGSAATIAVAGALTYYNNIATNKSTTGGSNTPNQSKNNSSNTPSSAAPTTTAATTPLMTFSDHTKTIWAVSWSPDGKYIASASADGTSHIWNVATKQRLYSYRSNIQPAQSDDGAYSVCWTPDNTQIAIGFSDGTAQTVNLANYQETGSYDSTTGGDLAGSLYAVSISPDGNTLALGGFFSNDIQLFDIKTHQKIRSLSGHSDTIWGISWSHNGKYIASASGDATARVWDATSGKALLIYDKHGDDVRAVSWSSDDKRIVSCSTTGPVYIWASDSGQTLLTYGSTDDFEILATAWSHNGKYIASAGGSDTYTHIWNAQNAQTIQKVPAGAINSVSWSPDDTRITTANNSTVQVWQL